MADNVSGLDRFDVLVIVGVSAACYGIWQISPPAAWIVGGAAVFLLGMIGSRAAGPTTHKDEG